MEKTNIYQLISGVLCLVLFLICFFLNTNEAVQKNGSVVEQCITKLSGYYVCTSDGIEVDNGCDKDDFDFCNGIQYILPTFGALVICTDTLPILLITLEQFIPKNIDQQQVKHTCLWLSLISTTFLAWIGVANLIYMFADSTKPLAFIFIEFLSFLSSIVCTVLYFLDYLKFRKNASIPKQPRLIA